jgi:iron complex outermembrane recepter protein
MTSSRCLQRTALSVAVLVLWPLHAAAQAGDEPSSQTIVITGSAVERKIAEAPYAISVVDSQSLRDAGPMINLSEAMARVPGIAVANRNNYAQDLQISSRGFGARAGFGVRGVRLYTDGIPASMPDGQGQVSHFDLAGAQRIEVLRGPFSVLYGNSSGGVIAAVSAPVREGRFDFGLDVGDFGLRQWRIGGQAPLGDGLELRVAASGLEWKGFRPQSAASKTTGNVRLAWQGERDRIIVLGSALDQPADDPLGLTQAQFTADPYQTTSQAAQFKTRKTLAQTQVGGRWTHRFDGWGPLAESAVTAYSGERAVAQWLAIAAVTQANPRHGGGLIDFDRSYRGIDARLTWQWGKAALVTGVSQDQQSDARRGFLNYTGTQAAPVYGGVGTLRRDENNQAKSRDVYAQLDLPLGDTFGVSAGLRSGKVRLSAADKFLSNGDDSGQRDFSYTNPVLGLRWQFAPQLNLHASVARGFESPTLGELAYRTDGTGGFNVDLQPQKSKQAEVGLKWRSASGALAADVALFDVQVDDEISVATNAGGRQSFRNVGRTQRRGVELAGAWRITPQWRASTAITLLNATYRDAFLACAGIPCNAPTLPVAAGNRIAGTQRGLAFGELAWQPTVRTEIAAEARKASALMANDTNTEAAAPYTVFALRARQRYALADKFQLELLARLDNVGDKAYVGSVIVNDANGRYYESAAPRAWLVSMRLTRSF